MKQKIVNPLRMEKHTFQKPKKTHISHITSTMMKKKKKAVTKIEY